MGEIVALIRILVTSDRPYIVEVVPGDDLLKAETMRYLKHVIDDLKKGRIKILIQDARKG